MKQGGMAALARLMKIAQGDTGQCRRVADFLLAWHNAAENGGWDPTALWGLDRAIAEDILSALDLCNDSQAYPGDLGFDAEIKAIWQMWRGGRR